MDNEKRKPFEVWLSKSEREKIKQLAQSHGMSMSAYMRNRAIGKEEMPCPKPAPKVIIHEVDPELVRQIARIGNNINQIARHLNTKRDELTGAELMDAITTLKAIEDDLSLLAEAYTNAE